MDMIAACDIRYCSADASFSIKVWLPPHLILKWCLHRTINQLVSSASKVLPNAVEGCSAGS